VNSDDKMVKSKQGQADLRMLLGIFVIMFGALGVGALGVGIMINNSAIAWFGGVLTALIGVIGSTIKEFIG